MYYQKLHTAWVTQRGKCPRSFPGKRGVQNASRSESNTAPQVLLWGWREGSSLDNLHGCVTAFCWVQLVKLAWVIFRCAAVACHSRQKEPSMESSKGLQGFGSFSFSLLISGYPFYTAHLCFFGRQQWKTSSGSSKKQFVLYIGEGLKILGSSTLLPENSEGLVLSQNFERDKISQGKSHS